MSALVLIINCIRGSKERWYKHKKKNQKGEEKRSNLNVCCFYSELLVTRKIGKDIIAAILGDIERLHSNEESKNFELG